ncbi:beta-mannanase [Brevibacillus ruminantium]|uniref:Beta-mannanase n=1 Tax=Brevibacillus ruminantium TaxID=2950604 RepID=A0ABY4WJN0_9BACL|nr:beta-mannanase [Brevibacillus ruminantium]USG65569.1 beta-mannanase [Brevibacillus ruminantium]
MIEMEETDRRLIKDVTCQLQGSDCVINWHWPDSVPCVYVHKSPFDAPFDPLLLTPRDVKLYTREEYKVNRGYREPAEGIGRYTYRIFPCELRGGKPIMLLPQGDSHIGHISTGKAKIYYSVKSKKSWFRPYQSIQIRIFSELPLSKDVLCYVKKEGSYPANKEDGTQYAFIRDLEPGTNLMPEIEIGKNDFIRLFFTDGKKYGELYELIPE